ncbi:unnamed protein product [Pseudo-nitzschia multistriata]|uniref:Uncharacterized protein n=1 Tax=Pseudo-nitzschia multistriata TaxID=183589 RepID=A0A448YYB3_9STRA|nr:unnamed protein product [Pseudo-nitzschia multistriata]
MSSQRCAWDFDHGTDFVVARFSFFFENFCGNRLNQSLLVSEFFDLSNQRNHYIWLCVNSGVDCIQRSFENSSCLHFNDGGTCDAKSAPTQTQHRVDFLHRFNLFF